MALGGVAPLHSDDPGGTSSPPGSFVLPMLRRWYGCYPPTMLRLRRAAQRPLEPPPSTPGEPRSAFRVRLGAGFVAFAALLAFITATGVVTGASPTASPGAPVARAGAAASPA